MFCMVHRARDQRQVQACSHLTIFSPKNNEDKKIATPEACEEVDNIVHQWQGEEGVLPGDSLPELPAT